MCIIVVKPAGIELPAPDVLSRCFGNNPDGAGYMYTTANGMVRIRKGYMTLVSLIDSLETIEDTTSIPMVLHFRITTQGNTNAANTHPFPVVSKHEPLVARSSLANVGVAHNGIIPLTTSSTHYDTNNKETYSDTYYFVRDYFSNIVSNDMHWWKNENLVTLTKKLVESKLAVLSGNGHIQLIGNFELADDGCLYSNYTYKYSVYTHAYDTWDDYDGYNVRGTETAIEKYRKWYGFNSSEEMNEFLGDGGITVDEGEKSISLVGSFVPEGVFVLDEDTGVLTDGMSDSYVHDKFGRVYWYDDHSNSIIELEGMSTVDENMNLASADPTTSIKFTCWV